MKQRIVGEREKLLPMGWTKGSIKAAPIKINFLNIKATCNRA